MSRPGRFAFKGLAVVALVLGLAPPAAAAPECRLDPRCPSAGRCTALEDDCVVGSYEECVASGGCQNDGRCDYDPSRHSCDFPLGAGAVDCRATPACRSHGLCQHRVEEWGRGCFPSATSCQASFGCKMFGACAEVGFACGADGDDACARSPMCKLLGACRADTRDGSCFTTPSSCRRAPICKRAGRCATDEFSAHSAPDPCRPTLEGCAASEVCALFGRCAVSTTGCAVERCDPSTVCTKYGACTLVDGRCRVAAPEPPERAPGGCEVVEVRGLTATASTFQKPWQHYGFGPEQLVDRDLGTSWQAEKKKGVGAHVEVRLPAPMRVVAVAIANGFQRRDELGDLYAQNGIIGHADLRLTPTVHEVVELGYERTFGGSPFGFQEIRFTPTETASISIDVLSVSGGLLFDDLAVSEIRVFACKVP